MISLRFALAVIIRVLVTTGILDVAWRADGVKTSYRNLSVDRPTQNEVEAGI